VPFEVVPGVTSAIAVPAYAGVPVTHRGLATSFTVVTGHSRHAVDIETNWEALAQAGGTIVVLMGVAHRGVIADRLVDGGLAPDTPVLGVHWGTRPDQVSVRVRLDELAATPMEPPVTLVIGPVAAMDLDWYESRPLFAKKVVVTRARAQASELSRKLVSAGAVVVEVPTIRIDPPSDGGAGLERGVAGLRAGRYEWVILTSVNAVEALLGRIEDLRVLAGARIAVVGSATAEALGRRGLLADLIPERQQADGLLEVFPAPPGPDARVLFPRAAEGREVLVEGLPAAGWQLDVVEAYRTVPVPVSPEVLADVAAADAVCFTSSSTVSGFLEACGPEAIPPVVVCIGPVTAATAVAAGFVVNAIADRHSIDGLVVALIEALIKVR
jgi:uroporphyrinogen III methyltransferase/synthase